MQGLNRPLAADEPGQDGGAGTGGVQAGDAERGDVGQRRAVRGGDAALDQVHLADVRERQVRWRVEDLDSPGGDPAMAAVSGGMGGRDVGPGQGVEGVEQAGLAIAVNDREPATTAAAASASTAATG